VEELVRIARPPTPASIPTPACRIRFPKPASPRRPPPWPAAARSGPRQPAGSTSWAAAAAPRPTTSGPSRRPSRDFAPRRLADPRARPSAERPRSLLVLRAVAPAPSGADLPIPTDLPVDPTRPASTVNFVNIGERTNVAGSPKFKRLISPATTTGPRHRQAAGRERRPDHRRQHGRRHARRRRRDDPLPQPHRRRARHRPGAGDDRLLQVVGHRGRPQVRPGQAIVNSISSRRARRSSSPGRDSSAATAPRSW
jgi:hypothetical protein